VTDETLDEGRTMEAPAEAPAPERARGREARRLRGRATPAVASPSEQAVHIDDRISKLFVAGTVAVFVLIFLNGLLLGRGGALVPEPTPTPVPSVTAAPSASPSASGSASPGASSSASPAPSPS
jgi:hypothetical protein